jgi:hypothetical protein
MRLIGCLKAEMTKSYLTVLTEVWVWGPKGGSLTFAYSAIELQFQPCNGFFFFFFFIGFGLGLGDLVMIL